MQISEGEGWRLVVDPTRRPYGALIGGPDWAVELDRVELACLRLGVLTLLRQRRELMPCLMAEEALDLDLELAIPAHTGDHQRLSTPQGAAEGSLFLALSGDSHRWTLRFVLTPANGSRAAEGGWNPRASAALAAALEGLADDSGGPH